MLAGGVVRPTPCEVTRCSCRASRADYRYLAAVRLSEFSDVWRESAHDSWREVQPYDHRRHCRRICESDEPSVDRFTYGCRDACCGVVRRIRRALKNIELHGVDLQAIGLSAQAPDCPIAVEIIVATDERSENRVCEVVVFDSSRHGHLTDLRFSGCGPRAERESSVAGGGPQSASTVS
jgi:hypothetical protein